MSIPKLKVYRLDQGYNPANDDDIQNIADDELLPVVSKDLNVFNTEELVGVTLRIDGRMIYASDVEAIGLQTISEEGTIIKTLPTACDDWILDDVNFDVYVKVELKSSGDFESDLEDVLTNGIFDEITLNGFDWYKINKNTFRSLISTEKISVDEEGLEVGDIEEAVAFQQRQFVTFELGQMLFADETFWEGGYELFHPIVEVIVVYKTFSELSNETLPVLLNDIDNRLCVPFGNIYNGNRSGRNTDKGFYEGNYQFRRSVMPFRFKVGQVAGYTSEFVADTDIIDGQCVFEGELDWYIDGNFKPIAMERKIIDDKKVFSPLQEGLQINAITPTFDDGKLKFVIAFNENYYRKSAGIYLFPKEVFLVYNLVNDRLGAILDFDYDYQFDELNSGKLRFENTLYKTILANGNIYKKRDILAVQSDCGYEDELDLLLEVGNMNGANFEASNDNPTVAQAIIPYDLCKSGEIDFSADSKRIYIGGNLAYDDGDINGSGYQITFEVPNVSAQTDGKILVELGGETTLPKDLMIVYYEKQPISFAENDGTNPLCVGYRIVCYQKTKVANLFVSSFTNWVKDHLNNNPDIFIGNTEYSGTETSAYTTDGIYPQYIKDGYDIHYADGAIYLHEPVEQFDYYDIYNFANKINPNIIIDNYNELPIAPTETPDESLKIYYQKVRANYAHYDGIYNVLRARLSCYTVQNGIGYKLLEDDDFKDLANKRLVQRSDSQIRQMYESGTVQLPEIKNSDINQREVCKLLTEFEANARSIWRVNTSNDRIQVFNFMPSGNTNSNLVICLDRYYNGDTEEITVANLTDDDIRFHLNLIDGVLTIGEEVDNTKPLTNNELFGREIDWLETMPEKSNIYNDINISDLLESMPRYVYQNENWNHDIVFELFSYRWSGNSISSIEFIIYRIVK